MPLEIILTLFLHLNIVFSDCKMGVCRKCSIWDPNRSAWTCSNCNGQR